MPRYYFHCTGDDTEGLDLPDDGAARREARATFGEMLRDGTVDERDYMEVVDDQGRRVAKLSFRSE
jgi:hypothetical protein